MKLRFFLQALVFILLCRGVWECYRVNGRVVKVWPAARVRERIRRIRIKAMIA